MERLNIDGFEGLKLACYLYKPKSEPKACVLIIHGMQEHAGRYEHFAEFLAANGYIVLASDLRGHGHTAENKDRLGYGKKDIYSETIADQCILIDYLNNTYNLPIYVFSHSYGSMLTQRLMQVNPLPKKFVLCGTANGGSMLMRSANVAASVLSIFGKDRKAKIVESLSFGSYAKKFKNGNWLSRDDSVLEKYNADEYCGGSFPYSFYRSLFSNLCKVNKGIKNVSNDTQILFIAGTDDPVGEYGKQVEKLHKLYIKNGKNAQIKLYPECRHELINELNKQEVYNYVLKFFEDR